MTSKNVKSILSIVLFAGIVLSLHGCGSSPTPSAPVSPPATATPPATEPPPPTPPPPTPPPPPAGRSHLRVNTISVSAAAASKDDPFVVDLAIENIGNAKSNIINIEIRAAVSGPTGASNVVAGMGSCNALNPGEAGLARIKIVMSQAIRTTGNFVLTPVIKAYESDIEPNPPQRSIIIN